MNYRYFHRKITFFCYDIVNRYFWGDALTTGNAYTKPSPLDLYLETYKAMPKSNLYIVLFAQFVWLVLLIAFVWRYIQWKKATMKGSTTTSKTSTKGMVCMRPCWKASQVMPSLIWSSQSWYLPLDCSFPLTRFSSSILYFSQETGSSGSSGLAKTQTLRLFIGIEKTLHGIL